MKVSGCMLHASRRIWWLAVSAAFVAVAAATTPAFADKTVKEVDKRDAAAKAAKSQYFLVFQAHGKAPVGHAWVAWGAEDHEKQASTQEAFGMYPAEEGKQVIIGTVPGKIQSDGDKVAEARLIVRVTKKAYDSAYKLLEGWKKKTPEYKLKESDCVTFTAQVAKDCGLALPKREGLDNLPINYIKALIEKN